MRRIAIVVLMALGLMAVQPPAVASTTGVHSGGSLTAGTAYSESGQTFTVPASAPTDTFFSKLTIDKYVPFTATTFTVSVSALGAGGFPTGAPLWTSPVLTARSGAFSVYPNITVTPGTKYAFHMTNAARSATLGANGNPYPGGNLISRESTGGSWGNFSTLDMDFEAEFNTGKGYTGTAVSCTPSELAIGQPTTCIATVSNLGTGLSTPGGTVNFTSSGAGTFSAPSCQLTNATCSVTYTPTAGGTRTITGSYSGTPTHTPSTGTAPLTVKFAQAIDTSQLPSAGFARMSMPLNAYGGASGNPVVLSVDPATTNGACTVNGNIVTYVRAGSCVINFNQAGNATYSPAPQVTRTFQVFGFGF